MIHRDPKISVFITSYNQKDYLVQAMDSVLKQSLKPFEIIVADDCSTDGSQKVIENYVRAYPELVRPFYQSVNQGIPLNKTFALEQVRGQYVSYLDGDDRFLPGKLEEDVRTLRANPKARIAFSNFHYIDENGIRLRLWAEDNVQVPTGWVFREVLSRTYPRNTLFRNELIEYEALKAVGFYDKAFAMYHDWELRIRLTSQFRVAYSPVPLSEYRIHSGGISRSVPSRHLDELERAYSKNASIVNALAMIDRSDVERRLFGLFERLAYRSAIQRLKEGEKRAAFQYAKRCFYYRPRWAQFPLCLLLALPHSFCIRLINFYKKRRKLLSQSVAIGKD
jgi:glycosyltransferase involved in cell wall biosynthesis